MKVLDFIVKRFKIDLSKESPFMIPIGRFKDMPKLFAELGFTKGAEIGVYRATYSETLYKRIPNLHLIGVDLWEAYPGFKDFGANDLIDARKQSEETFKRIGGTIIQDWSHNAAEQVEDESLDFVFIDGNHAYEYVVQDIALWSKKVKKGGIIYGHDYDDYSNHKRWAEMNVIPAVDGWMKSYKIHPWFVITNNRNKCWFYVKN